MSYILDALRKSDQQRQRGTAPTLLTAPPSLMETRQPRVVVYWVLGAILLGAGIAIGWLYPWQHATSSAKTTVRTLPQTDSPQADSRPRHVPAPIAPAPRQASREPQAALRAPAPIEVAPESVVVAQRDLPLLIQRALPELQISMHAYSAQPEARLVRVNDKLLREGDSAAAGVRLEKITPDGMIFSYRNYRFRRGVR